MNSDGYFEQDGVRMYYTIRGNGPQILFLHGVAISTQSCKGIIDELAKHYTVIAPDLPNFGKSSVTPKIWCYEDYADYISKFVESLNSNILTLAGTSFGAEIALKTAVKTRRVSKLVIASATGRRLSRSIFYLIYVMVYSKVKNNLRLYKNPRLIEATRKDALSNIFNKAMHVPRLLGTVIKCIYWNEPLTKALNTPALALWAEFDELMEKQSLLDTLKFLPNCKLVTLNEGHDWPLYKPKIFTELINQWLEKDQQVPQTESVRNLQSSI